MTTSDLYQFLDSIIDAPLYPEILPQRRDDWTFPAVVYSLDTNPEHLVSDPAGHSLSTLTLDIISPDHLEAAALADEIRETLDGYSGSIGASYGIVWLNRQTSEIFALPDGSEETYFIQHQEWSIRHNS